MRPTTALALLASAILAAPLARAEHRYVFAERVPLALDPTRIALRAGDASRAQVEAALAAAGLAPASLEAWPIRGWWLAGLAPARRTPEGARAAVARLAEAAGFERVAPVFVGEDGGPVFPTGDVLARFEPELGSAFARAAIALREGVAIAQERWGGLEGAYRLETASRDGFEALRVANGLALEPGVAFAEPDLVYTGSGSHVPNDPQFDQCWGLHNTGQSAGWTADVDVDAVEAWDLETGDPSIVVAVIDVGVEPGHADLNLAPGVDVTTDQSPNGGPFNACDNHGTMVAGCVSAVIDNQIGVVGSAPGCRVASVRALQALPACNFQWTTSTATIVAALDWIQQSGARVTNCSNGLMSAAAVTAKYQAMHAAGIVHFGSAGNSGSTSMHYPSTLDVVLGVSATAPDGTLASFSNFGAGLDLSAPGVDVRTTDRSGSAGVTPGSFVTMSGTSFATPYAAGVAALVLSRNHDLSPAQVEHVLRATATDLGTAGRDPQFGFGLVNARAALELGGDGCPAAASECASGPNSSGAAATIAAAGSTSVLANALTLSASGCPPNVNARFFFGAGAAQTPYGNGLLCVASPTVGLPVVATDAAGTASQSLDLAGLGIAPATTRRFQLVFRDPAAGGASFDTSDAVAVTFCP